MLVKLEAIAWPFLTSPRLRGEVGFAQWHESA
jgi:hypothetical protein